MSTPLQPCGTRAAYRRHKNRDETCETCKPAPTPLMPCGTPAAWRRHRKQGETACEPCATAYREYDTANRRNKGTGPRPGGALPELIDELEHLTGLGQGTDYILRAINYTGRERQLRDRLSKHGRLDLYHRAISEEYWAAA